MLQKGCESIEKYSDITSVYEILEINDEYTTIKVKNEKNYLYFFRFNPVLALKKDDRYLEDVLNRYEEFLRNLNIEFEIYIINEKIRHEDFFYINMNYEDERKKEMHEKYEIDLQGLINNSHIYIQKFFVIFFSKSKVENVGKYIEIFNESDVKCEMIRSKREIERIIMKGVDLL